MVTIPRQMFNGSETSSPDMPDRVNPLFDDQESDKSAESRMESFPSKEHRKESPSAGARTNAAPVVVAESVSCGSASVPSITTDSSTPPTSTNPSKKVQGEEGAPITEILTAPSGGGSSRNTESGCHLIPALPVPSR